MKKLIRVGLLSSAAIFGYGLSTSLAQTSWTCPEGFEGQSLSVYNWTTYIAEDTISNFEELCGVSVVYDTFPTDGDMLTRIRQGNPGYDVTFPGNSTLPLMIEEGLVEQFDKDNIPNMANLEPTFMGQYFDPNNDYSVPYQWGTIGIGYNRTKIGNDLSSWEEFFSHEGAISIIEDVRAMMGIALLMVGKDPNSTSEEDINAAKDYLIEMGQNITYINQDDGQEVLARGEIDMTSEYSGDIFQIMADCDCEDYGYVIPTEGANYWFDSIVIPAGAPNKALAEVFIDYVLDPQVGADISNYTAYGSPNKAAIDQGLIAPELLANTGIYPTQEAFENLFFVVQDSETEYLYNNAWEEVKIALGQ
jgi:spermidine/putrescine transport system substrate-binding protein